MYLLAKELGKERKSQEGKCVQKLHCLQEIHQQPQQQQRRSPALEIPGSTVVEQQSGVLEPSAIWQTAWDEFERSARTSLAAIQSPSRR